MSYSYESKNGKEKKESKAQKLDRDDHGEEPGLHQTQDLTAYGIPTLSKTHLTGVITGSTLSPNRT